MKPLVDIFKAILQRYNEKLIASSGTKTLLNKKLNEELIAILNIYQTLQQPDCNNNNISSQDWQESLGKALHFLVLCQLNKKRNFGFLDAIKTMWHQTNDKNKVMQLLQAKKPKLLSALNEKPVSRQTSQSLLFVLMLFHFGMEGLNRVPSFLQLSISERKQVLEEIKRESNYKDNDDLVTFGVLFSKTKEYEFEKNLILSLIQQKYFASLSAMLEHKYFSSEAIANLETVLINEEQLYLSPTFTSLILIQSCEAKTSIFKAVINSYPVLLRPELFIDIYKAFELGKLKSVEVFFLFLMQKGLSPFFEVKTNQQDFIGFLLAQKKTKLVSAVLSAIFSTLEKLPKEEQEKHGLLFKEEHVLQCIQFAKMKTTISWATKY